MSKNWFRRLAVLMPVACGLVAPAAASQYILELTPGTNISQVTGKYGLMLIRPLTGQGETVYLVSPPYPASPDLLTQIRSDPAVREIELDAEVDSPEHPPASPPAINVSAVADAIQNRQPVQYYGSTVRAGYVQQPSATLIRLPDALTRFAGGGEIVAVIDTGVDPGHPALKGVLVPGYDFTRDQAGFASELADLDQSTVAALDQSTVAILDAKRYAMVLNQSTVAILDQSTVAILDADKLPSDFGHGTMVAGLIHLVAPTARIMPLKVFRADGSADLSDIVRAIYYAVDHQAKVINMSFSSVTRSASVTAAINYAWSHNVICVASGGNNGKHLVVYPAGDPGAIGVGSTDAQDQRSMFSNYDAASVRMAAPGEALITTYPGNNYAAVWGTSFSAALTSGTVALLTQISPQIRPGSAADALDHGRKLQIDGMGDARLDVLGSLMYYLFNR
jgi:subtilisin family serine protease